MNTFNKFTAKQLCCIRENKLLFKDISFELKAGEILLVEGPNGAGKSSLLRLLCGLATPSSGELFWNHELTSASATFLEDMHFIGHTNGLKLGLTMMENLQLTCHLQGSSTSHIDEILSLLQLSLYKNMLIKNLSAGQKRRIALAKLFILPRSLWILDEPLTALDLSTQTIFLTKLEEHLILGGFAIISSHHPIHIKTSSAKTVRLNAC